MQWPKRLVRQINLSIFDRNLLVDFLHVYVLSSFAIAQPLYDILSQYPTFFVAKKSEPLDLVVFTLVALIAVPSVCVFFQLLLAPFGKKLRALVHRLTLFGFVFCIALLAFRNFEGTLAYIFFAVAVLIGAAFVVFYGRLGWVRLFVTAASPAVIVFPAIFLFNPAINDLVLPRALPPTVDSTTARGTAPVVMVVFDEFSLAVLLGRDMQIDRMAFPNLAEFADQAYWFRNATTVSDVTHFAIPAILTGQYPRRGRPETPTLNSYPDNLFTLLAGRYDFNVHESVTSVCPPSYCRKDLVREKLTRRMRAILGDLRFVYFHLLLPPTYRGMLPAIDQGWTDFQATATLGLPTVSKAGNIPQPTKKRKRGFNRIKLFRRFLNRIELSTRPTFNFLHILLPHSPRNYLASGRTYLTSSPNMKIKVFMERLRWANDPVMMDQGLRNYILQVQLTDKLIGELVQDLKAKGLYDKALIVMTADHGVSLRPGDLSRPLTKTNFHDIIPVPLFIKLPGQSVGVVSDRNVETIDILPTMMDALGKEVPFKVDGQSLLKNHYEERSKKLVLQYRGRQTLEFPPNIRDKKITVDRIADIFGPKGHPDRWFMMGQFKSLYGKRLKDVTVEEGRKIKVAIEDYDLFMTVDLDSPISVSNIRGGILSSIGGKRPIDMAVAVNGTIRGTFQTLKPTKQGIPFYAQVPENAFRAGSNDVQVFTVAKGADGRIRLTRAEIVQP